MRRGVYTFNPILIGGIKGVLQYVGLHVSNTIMGFIYILFLVGLAVFPLFWPLFWIILWNHLSSILLLIAAAVVVPILKSIAKVFVIKKNFVYHRRF